MASKALMVSGFLLVALLFITSEVAAILLDEKAKKAETKEPVNESKEATLHGPSYPVHAYPGYRQPVYVGHPGYSGYPGYVGHPGYSGYPGYFGHPGYVGPLGYGGPATYGGYPGYGGPATYGGPPGYGGPATYGGPPGYGGPATYGVYPGYGGPPGHFKGEAKPHN